MNDLNLILNEDAERIGDVFNNNLSALDEMAKWMDEENESCDRIMEVTTDPVLVSRVAGNKTAYRRIRDAARRALELASGAIGSGGDESAQQVGGIL